MVKNRKVHSKTENAIWCPILIILYYSDSEGATRKESAERCVKDATTTSSVVDVYCSYVEGSKVDHKKVLRDFHEKLELDMNNLSCSDALNDLYTFYKVGHIRLSASFC